MTLMNIHVRTYGLRYLSGGHLPEVADWKVREGATVSSLARELNLSLRDVGLITVNGRLAAEDTELHDGDDVRFFAVVAGG